jgi:hypothetical protein
MIILAKKRSRIADRSFFKILKNNLKYEIKLFAIKKITFGCILYLKRSFRSITDRNFRSAIDLRSEI